MSTVTPSRPPRPRPRPEAPRPGGASSRAATIDPIRVLRRHALLLVASALLGGAVGTASYFVLLRVYPLYRGDVYFEVRPGLRESTDIATVDIASDDVVVRIAKTETYVLTQREVVQAAVENPDVRQTQWYQTYLRPDGTPAIDDALDDLLEELSPNLVRDSNLFSLSWATHEATDIPVVLNGIARAYLERRKASDSAVYNENVSVFQSQLSQTNRDLEDLERETSSFIRERDITTLGDVRFGQKAQASELATEQLSNAQASLGFAVTQYQQVAAKLEGTLEPSPDDILQSEQSLQVQSLTNLVQQLKTELRYNIERFRNDHPTVRELEGRLSAAERELQDRQDEVIRRNLEAQKKVLEGEIEQYRNMTLSLEKQILQLNAELRNLTADQTQFEAMQLRRDRLEARREAELQLIKEAQLMRMRQDASRVQVAQWALAPREISFPDLKVMPPLGALVFTGLITGLVFLREITDSRVKSGSDLAVIPGANILGVIPELEEDPTKTDSAELAVWRHPHGVIAETYRQAMTGILRQFERTGYQTMLLASGLPNAGTTTAATNLAAGLAATGKRVLVVDANFRRPRLAEAMDVDGGGAGLGDVLAEQAVLDDAIRSSECGVDVMPAGTPAHRVYERLSNGRIQQLLAEMRNRYDIVIFDAPPAVVAGEALVLANIVDAAVLVVRANQEQRGLVARLIHQLREAPCELLGILLNRPRGTAGGYFKKNYATMAGYALKEAG